MSNHIFEEGPRRGHAAGNTSIEQQASQLTSDIRYKARQKMKDTSGSSMSPGQVQQLYRQLLGSSSAPGGVKAIVKKKLFKEQIDTGVVSVSEHVKDSSSYVYSIVFSEAEEKKFVVRVTDRETGNTTYRKADRAKISELRANKNISSVEITGRKEVDDAYKGDPKPNYGGKKAKKDYDGDGKVESGSKEHAGAVHNAIQRKKGGVADGKDTRKEEYIDEAPYQVMGSPDGKKEKKIGKPVKSRKYADSRAAELADTHKTTGGQYRSKYVEEVIYEKDGNGEKKLDVMKKGKNTVKINPSLGESIRAELDLLKAQKIAEQDASMKQQEDEKKKEQLAAQQGKKDKMMKIRILQNKMRAVRGGAEIAASHELEGDTIAEGEDTMRYCPACDKDETRDECKAGGEYWDENSKPAKEEDPRSMPTKINLAKNKLRAMGLKMSYDMEGDMVDEKYQGMYQSPAPTYNRLNSKDPKARMSPGSRAMAKSDKLQSTEPGSKRAKKQKKVSDQINRNFQSARKTVGEGLSVKDQMKVSQEYFKKRNSRSPEEKKAEADKDAKSRAKNYAMHKRPDPYKSRPGESD